MPRKICLAFGCFWSLLLLTSSVSADRVFILSRLLAIQQPGNTHGIYLSGQDHADRSLRPFALFCSRLLKLARMGQLPDQSGFALAARHHADLSDEAPGVSDDGAKSDTRSGRLRRSMFALRFGAPAETVKVQINDRSGVKGKHLRNDQSTDDRHAEGLANLRTIALADGQWNRTKQGRQSGHHNRPKTNDTSLVDRLGWCQSVFPFCLQRKINHHDRVLLYDPD